MKVLVVAGDAGGARAVQPVIAKLRERHTVDCVGYGAARTIWSADRIEMSTVSPAEVSDYDRVLTATSVGPVQLEPEFIRAARAANRRVVTLLDAWGSYWERFRARSGELALPDAVGVMHEEIRLEMRELGFDEGLLVVTGHPGFDRITDERAVVRQNVLAIRRSLGIGDAIYVLYVSQPESPTVTWSELGFDEEQVLEDLAGALSAVIAEQTTSAVLLVKLHPRQYGSSPRQVVDRPGIRVRVLGDDRIRPRDAAGAADLVVGISSILLLEACLLGRPVVSYQPGLRRRDDLPTDRWGWSRGVYTKQDLRTSLFEELFDRTARARRQTILANAQLPSGATERVIQLLVSD